ncbi:WbuC family cupin fold metalloprotein [Uliginosibacterium sp. 31-12]|uniref:WbuC family cupin fold metalloprotein n=1 Tax=Uliginosibacterium sp. 31-12 TaxID=3062781 RepID=UPI0026E44C69|nr:WbuC family cupin fold metalloprotein [Uliginosibacterium sp. 31-12]MDO6386016.1 WbuC family cupin fold metalloprotein [Uliginosibacterium sp. 31-12]
MSAGFFDQAFLDALSVRARENPRRRQNHNLHPNLEAPAQRFFNAIEPGSYVRPHRHLAPGKEETLLMVRGRLGLVFFDESGAITSTYLLSANSQCIGARIPLGCWHSVVALEAGSVFFEVKDGPYLPITAEEQAPWAPSEGCPAAAEFEQALYARF